MEAEVRGYKGVILDLEGKVVAKNSFEKPRIAFYKVKLYDAEKITTIELLNVNPEEIKVIKKKGE